MKAWQTTDGSHQVFSAHSWSNSCTMVYKYNRYAFLKVTRNIVPCPNLAPPLIFCQIFYRQFEITNCIRNLAIHDSSKWREREREKKCVSQLIFVLSIARTMLIRCSITPYFSRTLFSQIRKWWFIIFFPLSSSNKTLEAYREFSSSPPCVYDSERFKRGRRIETEIVISTSQ